MSGTSIDGIDAGLVDFSEGKINVLAFHYQPFTPDLRERIHQLSQPAQAILLEDYGRLDSELGELFAHSTLALLDKIQIPPKKIQAIGSHGQTVYHAPNGAYGFSLQIGDPNRISEITGITTVSDFRRRDIAVGGQGAPLVPAFHQAAFADTQNTTTVLNIGGIANITILRTDAVSGFDTGPGNTLMDYWCRHSLGQNYDANGDWASKGQVNKELLNHLLDDVYFRQAPPKSTGKEYFSPVWLQQKISPFLGQKPEDIQATLCEFSAETIADAINTYAGDSKQILVCGGGIHNRRLLELLRQRLSVPVVSTAKQGIDPDHVEAVAFAWLAKQTIEQKPGNLCKVTGAKSPVVLGGIYPGRD